MAEEEENKIDYIKLFRNICLAIIVITIIYFFAINFLSPYDNRNETRGTFGDLFGGLNAIFSGFAFAGVIITILMQMKELELTRKELRKSADAQEKSQQALNEQLNQMKITSRIESVKNIIDSYSSRDEKDKKEVAKAVLEKLTEQIFYAKEFEDIVKPNLQLNSAKFEPKRGSTASYGDYRKKLSLESNNGLVLDLKNIGPSIKLKIKVIEPIENTIKISRSKPTKKNQTTTTYSSLKEGETIERDTNLRLRLKGITKTGIVKLQFEMEGEFVREEWLQTHILKIDDKLSVEKETSSLNMNTDDNKL